MKASEAIRNKCIPILTFDKSNEKGVHSVEFGTFDSIKQTVEMPALTNLNVLWHASNACNSGKPVRPNWSGYICTVPCNN